MNLWDYLKENTFESFTYYKPIPCNKKTAHAW
jgi:hypothetical protein